MLHSAFKGGESLAMKSNSIYFPKKKKNEKTPHHLTFPFETPLFTSGSESEVFGKHLTQHLTQQVTFFSDFRLHQVSKSGVFRKRINAE